MSAGRAREDVLPDARSPNDCRHQGEHQSWIKVFISTSPNAVKTQIWVAISVYVLVTIIKKRLHRYSSLFTILQFLSVHLFEKFTLREALTNFTFIYSV